MRFKWRIYLPFIGIAIFIYILLKLDLSQVLNEISNIKPVFLLGALILVLILILIQTFKWFLIARKQNLMIPFSEALKVNFISNFYGFVTPSKLGTIIRADYLKKYGRFSEGVINFVLDKIMDIFSLFTFAIVMGYFFKDKFNFFSWSYLLIIFLAFLGLFLLMYNKTSSRFFLGSLYRYILPKKIKQKLSLDFDSFYENLPKKRFLLVVFLVNILTWLNTYLITYLVGLSFGIDLPFVYFLAILPLATIVAQIPITINGLGTREAVMIGLFGFFGIGAEKVFSMSILTIILASILPSILTSFLIFRKRE